MAIATLTVKLQAQLAEFQSEFREAAKATEKFQQDFEKTATKSVAIGNIYRDVFNLIVNSASSMGKAVLENASNITDLSNKTGLATETIQQFQFVADQTGTTVDAFADAAFRLGAKLAGGGTSVVKAVTDLGLSFKEIQTLTADEKFNTIAEALGRIEDPGERARLGLILFDRTFKNIAPAIAEGYRKMAEGAETSTRAQLDAIDALDDAWKRFQANTLTRATNIAGGLVLAAEEIRRSDFFEILKTFGVASITGNPFQAFEAFAARGIARSSLSKQLKDVELENVIPPNFVRDLEEARAKIAGLSVETRKQIAAAKALGTTTDELSAQFGLSASELKVLTLVTSEDGRVKRSAARSVKAFSDAVVELNDVLKKTPDFELGLSSLPGFQIEIEPPDLSAYQGALKDQIELTQSNIPGIVIPPPTFEPLPPTFFQRAFGQEFGERLGFIIGDALTGGGVLNAVKNAASLIGSTLGKELANVLTTGKNALTGWLGGVVSTALPVIGSLLGPLVGKIGDLIQGAFGNRGRDAVKDFAASFGGFDALHARLLEMGAAGEALWIKLTQGVGRNNPEQAAAVIDEITRALDDFGTESERAATRVQAIGGAIDAINAKAVAFATPFQNLLKDEEAEDVKAKLAAIGEVGQAEFERIGTFAAAAFAGLVKETGDAIGAIQRLGPTFQVLQDGVEKFGLTTSGTIDFLLHMFSQVNDAVTGPILQAIQTTGQIFAGLQEGGILTAELFQTVATDIGASFRELEAKGGDVAAAMALSQPVLQRLWEAQQTYGRITDETTQKILNQAEEQGLVGDHMKDVNQKILDVLIAIADVFGAKIPDSMRATRDAATQTAEHTERAFSNIKISPITVGVDWDFEDFDPDRMHRSVPALASGGIVRRPTLALVGEAGPEAVIPLNQLGSVAPSGESTVIFEIDGRQIAAATVPYLPGEARRYVPA